MKCKKELCNQERFDSNNIYTGNTKKPVIYCKRHHDEMVSER